MRDGNLLWNLRRIYGNSIVCNLSENVRLFYIINYTVGTVDTRDFVKMTVESTIARLESEEHS